MAIAGQGTPVSGNFIRVLSNFVMKSITRNRVSTDPADGLILKMHYKWTFWLLLGLAMIVMGQWYHTESMYCVPKHNGHELLGLNHIFSFCESYIYIENGGHPVERRYLFFYKWLHYVHIILAFWYYMPRKLNKAFYKNTLIEMCNVLHRERSKYDENAEKCVLARVSAYINEHMGTHNSLYFNALFCNVFALFVNLTGITAINFVLQDRFINYGWKSIPFNRDVVNFTDPMSQTFPPFAQCTISRQHELIPGRDESFGCHLVLMEVYEKLFLGLWLWLMVLASLTVLYIIFLVLLFLPALRRWALKVQKPEVVEETVSHDDLFTGVLYNCKIGDVWLLYKLKKNLSATKYYTLLCELSKPSLRDVLRSDPAYRADAIDYLKGVQQPLLVAQAGTRDPMQGQQMYNIMQHKMTR